MNNNHKIDDKYDEYADDRAIRRDEKKKPKMPVESAFLKQIPKIQKQRYDEKYHPSTSLPRTYSLENTQDKLGQVGAGKYTNSTDITNNLDKLEKK
ncbi:MAG: hypothetical protein ACD_58C00068G0003 [uncultured bacterium]|nr:MAG: hypothetical protein ACD_58C00068G0003 [uncultured bacterium]